jgi:hypothetical protein
MDPLELRHVKGFKAFKELKFIFYITFCLFNKTIAGTKINKAAMIALTVVKEILKFVSS